MRHEKLLKTILERDVPASYLKEKYYQTKDLDTEEKNKIKDEMVTEIEKNYPLTQKQSE